MKLILHTCFIACLLPSVALAKNPPEKKQLTASRIIDAPKIDGLLNDACWDDASVAGGFIQNRPNPGKDASQRTEIKIIYDDEAIYVGAMMYDNAPDSILSQLTSRDQIGNSDFIGVMFSCFQDGINGFEFIVTPSGVQFDAQVSTFGEDDNWNAVWQCNTSITPDGWIAEYKIPYSALRFPDADAQTWDLNFFRTIRRHREQSFWQYVDPEVMGFVNQSGELNGIENIEPPMRLFFYPYASGYVELAGQEDGSTLTGTSYNGGMDVKYGINDAFTLDMTLIPDFGQVQSDNQILNLGPFEVRFNERRQFFTEGTELFSKGGLFYSRRIGGYPVNMDAAYDFADEIGGEVTSAPQSTQLINATKISGRNKGGLGIGLFNAVSGREYATVRDTISGEEHTLEVSPLTNYNILVLDQNLKNNSYVTLINTNVMRDGHVYDANVTGAVFQVRNKANSIEVSGSGKYNKKLGFEDASTDDGFAYSVGIDKISGNFLFGIGHGVESKNFDPNDLGFLYNPNEVSTYAWANYNIYEPFGRFNNLWSNLNIYHGMLQQPNEFTEFSINGNIGVNTKKFNTYNVWFGLDPVESHDYFEPRVDGWHFDYPTSWNIGGWYSSDYRKQFAFDFGGGYSQTSVDQWAGYNVDFEPRWRITDQFQIRLSYGYNNRQNQRGFTTIHTTDDDEEQIIFGRRDRITHQAVFNADYIFTNRMGLTFRLRHYWSTVAYKEFFQLNEEGGLNDSDYPGFFDDGTTDSDNSFNAFNIDMVYTWVFAPGSELRVVWKNSILGATDIIPETMTSNLRSTFDQPQNNSFSIKLLYFIDYLTLKNRSSSIKN
jgi:hypothetical protein